MSRCVFWPIIISTSGCYASHGSGTVTAAALCLWFSDSHSLCALEAIHTLRIVGDCLRSCVCEAKKRGNVCQMRQQQLCLALYSTVTDSFCVGLL